VDAVLLTSFGVVAMTGLCLSESEL